MKNFGVSARTMLNKGDRPYMKEQAYQQALAFNPNIVVIKLGTNDSKSFNWVHKADFIKDTQTMIDAFKALPSQPEIYLCYPSKAYLTGESINDDIISKEIIPMIKKVAKKTNCLSLTFTAQWMECRNYSPTISIPMKKERK